MRTSRVSQETTRIFSAISPNSRIRSTRSSKRIASFALGYSGQVEVKEEAEQEEEHSISDDTVSTAASAVEDIEDVLSNVRPPRKRRRLSPGSPSATLAKTVKNEIKTEEHWASPRRIQEAPSASSTPPKSKPKQPARKVTNPVTGKVTVQPPSNWAEMYEIVRAMRDANPTAPVDTMGCEDLFWRNAPAKERRYHTLTALMLSSQTKDTVTAAAMKRLHTELVSSSSAAATTTPAEPWDPEDGKGLSKGAQQSQLTVANMLTCDATHLDSLIGKVGFHNNKTKYIKATAAILRAQYDDDIPPTIEGLVALPGVGPKMAYLCLSAAWGVDEGIGVDVHVHRITNLWGWHATKTPEETRAALEAWLPRDRWHHINKMLVGLGQTVCLPVGRRCGDCDLAGRGLCKAEISVGRKERREKVKQEDERAGAKLEKDTQQ